MFDYVYDPIDGAFRLALAAILLAVAIILSRYKDIGIEKELIIGSVRAILQLSVVALVLTAIFESDMLILIAVMIAGMIVLAGFTSAKRAKGIPDPTHVTIPAIAIGASTVIVLLVALQVLPLKAEFIIPIGGMAVGNSMNICSLFLNNFKRELKTRNSEIEMRLALGATGEVALAPHMRFSIRSSLIPTIDNLKTLGLVFIPGAMTGMVIAGADPLWAAEYQLVVFFMIIASGVITTVIASRFVRGKVINAAEQLVELEY